MFYSKVRFCCGRNKKLFQSGAYILRFFEGLDLRLVFSNLLFLCPGYALSAKLLSLSKGSASAQEI